MKKLFIALLLIFVQLAVFACPVCERQQPKVLRGLVHGVGPQNSWDYIAVWAIGAIALLTLIFSIKYLIKPGEKNQNHIKYAILNNQ